MSCVEDIRLFKKEFKQKYSHFIVKQYEDLVDETKEFKQRKLVPLNDTNPILSLFGPKVVSSFYKS